MTQHDLESLASDEDTLVHDLCPFCNGDYSIKRDGTATHSEPPCDTYIHSDPHLFRERALQGVIKR